MAKRIDIATYIGRQETGSGDYLDLYNLLIPLRNAELHLTHPIGSTLTHKTLTRLVPKLVLPPNIPKVGDTAYSMT